MKPYQTILVAVDCSEDSITVIQRAKSIACDSAEVHLLHVVEPLALAYGADMPMDMTDLQTTLLNRAQTTINAYAEQFALDDKHTHVELGAIERTIQSKAVDIGADVIVIGCHTRSGLALLLGSTARGLVPSSRCDVLAVKIDSEK